MFVDTQWLADHLNEPDIRVVDVRFTRCFSNHDKVAQECWEDYLEGHILNAVYIDCIKDLTDPSFKDIFIVPPPSHFAAVMNRIGVTNDTLVVCYDEAPYPLGSARFWWTMHYFGHHRVKILSGGVRKWTMEGRPLSQVIPNVPKTTFTPKVNEAIRATKETVKRSLNHQETILIDCLPARTYFGKVINSWSIRKGHIPGAVWLPPAELIKGLERSSPPEERAKSMANDKPYPFFPIEDLRKIFSRVGVAQGKRVITYCGKGEASCSVFLALKMIGIQDVALYDGSLAEWSRDPDLPMEISGK